MNPHRCGRGKLKNDSLNYANEELVAEMGAMIICEELGLKYKRQNSLTYLNGWLKRANGTDIDSALIEAYSYACDAADYLLEGIDLEKLVPKTMITRAEKGESESEPGTAKPDGKKSILPDEGAKAKPKAEKEPTKETEPKKDKPEGGRNTFEKEYDDRLANAKQALDDAIKEHEEKYKKYLFSVMDGSMTQERMDELMKPIIGWVNKARTEYHRVSGQKDEVKKAASAQTSLFGLEKIGEVKKAVAKLLKGELGKFIGGYERKNYSIVLRGDKGAGKSRLLYQLVNLFLSDNSKYKAAILSLEMPKDGSIATGYRDSYLSKNSIERTEITDISQDYDSVNAMCKLFDIVAIDSWTKIRGIGQFDFDRLQKENPQTIILTVFQSTTGKVIRGGNMPEFDAAIVIHVHDGGVAVCEKNRYAATDNEYLVFEQKLRVKEPTEAD